MHAAGQAQTHISEYGPHCARSHAAETWLPALPAAESSLTVDGLGKGPVTLTVLRLGNQQTSGGTGSGRLALAQEARAISDLLSWAFAPTSPAAGTPSTLSLSPDGDLPSAPDAAATLPTEAQQQGRTAHWQSSLRAG